MTTVVVWVLFVFHGGGLPTAGILNYSTKADCEAAATAWRQYSCVKVEVPKK